MELAAESLRLSYLISHRGPHRMDTVRTIASKIFIEPDIGHLTPRSHFARWLDAIANRTNNYDQKLATAPVQIQKNNKTYLTQQPVFRINSKLLEFSMKSRSLHTNKSSRTTDVTAKSQ